MDIGAQTCDGNPAGGPSFGDAGGSDSSRLAPLQVALTTMPSLLAFLVVLISLAATGQEVPQGLAEAHAPVQTDARHYLVFTVNVPFTFTVDKRTFKAGQYKFAVLGPGLLGVLNTKTREAVHLITRDVQLAEVAPATHLTFTKSGKRRRLTSILLGGRAQNLQIVGEEMFVPQSPPQAVPLLPMDLFQRGKSPLQAH